MPQLAAQIWADGPSATPFEPPKPDIREWGTWIEQIIAGIIANGSHGLYQTRASLYADLAHPANYSAWVFGDPTTAYNGIYMKVGASGTGSWVRVGDLPYSFVRLVDAGAGTLNAIKLTSTIPTSPSVLRVANVFQANTGNVTISENGGLTKPLLTASGNQIASGGLLANMMIAYIDAGTSFRLLSDQASAALVAAAEAAAIRAEAARDAALGAVPNVFSPTRTALKALNTTLVTAAYLTEAGRDGMFIWRLGDYAAKIASDPYGGLYLKADGISASVGAWVRVGGWAVEGKNIRWFGAKATETAANNLAIIQSVIDMRGTVIIPDDLDGDYGISDTLLVRSKTTLRWTGNSFIKLTQASTIGGVIVGYSEVGGGNSSDILFDNPRVDGGNLGYVIGAATGENGIGGAFCDGLNIRGGVVKNCRNGQSAWSGTGGKGIQIENTVSNFRAEGTLIVDCTIGCETGGTATTPTVNGHYSNLTMLRCDTMICGRHSASPPIGGVETNSAVFEDITGYNCGKTTGYWQTQGFTMGAIGLDRVNNFEIRGLTLFNDASYGSISCLVRHYRGNNCSIQATFWGDCTNLINSASPIPAGFGSTGSRNNCLYDVRHVSGTADRVLITAGGDAANHAANIYKIKTATVTTGLFNSDAAQPDLFGFFENAAGDKCINGPLDRIAALTASNYPATADRANVGFLQFNKIFMSYSLGAQIIGTLDTDQIIFQPNQVEKFRITGGGIRAVLPTYATNAAAVSAGLVFGDMYQTSTGEVRIRV